MATLCCQTENGSGFYILERSRTPQTIKVIVGFAPKGMGVTNVQFLVFKKKGYDPEMEWYVYEEA